MKKGYKNITVQLTDEEFNKLAKEAHRQDITFNQLCVNYLEEYMNKEEKKIKKT